jgi:hypothetical protein
LRLQRIARHVERSEGLEFEYVVHADAVTEPKPIRYGIDRFRIPK